MDGALPRLEDLAQEVHDASTTLSLAVDPGTADGALRRLQAVSARLLRTPPAVVLDRAGLRALDDLARHSRDLWAGLSVEAIGVVAAWHLEGRAEPSFADRSLRWVSRAAKAVTSVPDRPAPRWADEAGRIADSVRVVTGLLGAVDPPDDVVRVLLRAAELQAWAPGPGRAEAATSYALDALELAQAGGRSDPVAARALARHCGSLLRVTVHGVGVGAVADLALLTEAFTCLDEPELAQRARLPLLEALVGHQLLPQAAQVLSQVTAPGAPVVVPEQAEQVELRRLRLLLALGDVGEVAEGVRALRGRLPSGHPVAIALAPLAAQGAAEAWQWGAARKELAAQLRAELASGSPTSAERASALTELMLQEAACALRLGDGPGVLAARGAMASYAGVSPALPTQLPIVDGWLAELRGDLLAARRCLEVAWSAADRWARSAPDRVAGGPAAVRVAAVGSRAAALAARTGDARGAFVSLERSRGEFLRAAALLPRDPEQASAEAAFRDLAARRATSRAAAADSRDSLLSVAARVLDGLRDAPTARLLHTPPAPIADPLAAVGALLGAAGPGACVVTVDLGDLGDLAVVAATDGRQTLVTARPVPRPGLLRDVADVFTRATSRGPRPRDETWRARAVALLDELHPLVGEPLLEAVRSLGARRVVLSLPGALACVPVAALGPGLGHPLLDPSTGPDGLTVVSGVVAAADAAAPGWWAGAPRRPSGRRTSVFAGASVDGTIPLAAAEAWLVAETWRASGVAARVSAPLSQQDLVSAAPTARVLHVASHASWSTTRVADGGLRLGEDLVDPGELLVALDVAGADLVVLSACDTAASALLPGGEAVNLASMVAVAGARQVVASLWPVQDQAALFAGVALHEQLARGVPADVAVLSVLRHLASLTYAAAVDLLSKWQASPPVGGAELDPTTDEARMRARRELADLAVEWAGRRGDVRPFSHLASWAPFACFGPAAS